MVISSGQSPEELSLCFAVPLLPLFGMTVSSMCKQAGVAELCRVDKVNKYLSKIKGKELEWSSRKENSHIHNQLLHAFPGSHARPFPYVVTSQLNNTPIS
jgi:hypothetical protein